MLPSALPRLRVALASRCRRRAAIGAGAGARAALRRADQPGRPARLAAADVVRAQPCRLAPRQGQCRLRSWRCSSNGAGTRISSASTCSIRRRSRPRSSWSRRSASRSAGRSRRWPRIRPRPTPPARFRPMSPTRATATSPRRWSTSITACPTIMTRSSSAAFQSRARSCSPATAAAGAGSSPSWRRSMARSAA